MSAQARLGFDPLQFDSALAASVALGPRGRECRSGCPWGRMFQGLADSGRPSMPPERLLRALLLYVIGCSRPMWRKFLAEPMDQAALSPGSLPGPRYMDHSGTSCAGKLDVAGRDRVPGSADFRLSAHSMPPSRLCGPVQPVGCRDTRRVNSRSRSGVGPWTWSMIPSHNASYVVSRKARP